MNRFSILSLSKVTFSLISAIIVYHRFNGNRNHFNEETERVPFYAAVIAAAIFPAIVIILTGAIARRSFYDVHSGILGLVLALALTTTLTDIVKVKHMFDRELM
jgi:ABC-type branched-subunit amino acid transport system permease subunit